MSSILSIGHPTLDLFLPLQDGHLQNVDGHTEELCLPYPDKLRVDRLDIHPGGNAVNVASGLRKLGYDAALYVHQSDDVPGQLLSEYFEEANLPVIGDLTKDESDVSVVLSYEGDRVILSHHAPTDWSWIGLPEDAEWVYLSSIGTEQFQPFHRALKEDLVAHPEVRCAYNPGSRELKQLASDLEILEVVELLILNRSEACRLLDREAIEATDEFIADIASELHECGPERIVITDGEEGAWAYDSGSLFFQPPFPTEVVESTGAGDSFSAGCVGALIEGKDLFEALRWGSAMAHAVLQDVGATEGFLTRSELDRVLKTFENLRPESRVSG